MKRSVSRSVIASTCLLCVARQLPAITVDIVSVADGFIQSSNSVFTELNVTAQRTRASHFGSSQSRGVFEFDLSSIPDGAVVLGASLVGTTASFTGGSSNGVDDVVFLGFKGDGVVDLSDAETPGTGIGVASFPQGAGNFLIGLIPSPIQWVLDDAEPDDFFALRGEANNAVRWEVFSLEAEDAAKPTLRLSYLVVPEPHAAAIALSLLAVAAPWWRSKHRQNGDAPIFS